MFHVFGAALSPILAISCPFISIKLEKLSLAKALHSNHILTVPTGYRKMMESTVHVDLHSVWWYWTLLLYIDA